MVENFRCVYTAGGGSPHVSRSQLYAHLKALPLAAELECRGRIDPERWRDAETGRKVRTVVYELARLLPTDTDPDPADVAAVADLYDDARTWPLAKLHSAVSQVQTTGR